MSAITTDERSALVLIDLQQGILALPALRDPDDIKTRARRLAAAFRASTLPVVRVELLILDQLGAQLRGATLLGVQPVRRLVLSATTTPESTVTLDRTKTAATQADSRAAQADVVVPGWCRERRVRLQVRFCR
jgi:hypothetical protein